MKLMYDGQTKTYLTALAAFGLAIVCTAVFLCYSSAAAFRAALLENNRLVASALLSQGVDKADLASAFTNTAVTDAGREFIDGIGLGAGTALSDFTVGRSFQSAYFAPVIIFTLLLMGAGVWATVWYFRRREKLYLNCADILDGFVDGNSSRRLPRGQTGGLYTMLAAADRLAMTLDSRSEGERKAKEGLREVISDVSHQLKTPLAALRLYVDLMSAKADDTDAVRDFSEKSRLSIDRIEGLVQTLLKVMRLDTGNVEFHMEECLVCDLAAKAAHELQTRAAVEGKTLTLTGDSEQRLYCDGLWTAEALMNLIKNALDYTGQGGSVNVSWEKSAGILRIIVKDDGRGIADEDMPFLFKRFYRSPHSRDIQGVGLGLPLTKSVVEGQGGMISVENRPEGGARFIMSFLSNLIL